mmetsp:Transcript_32157/g.83386  ORF Transcript_32157/g.83386 Transcript_32157/m.83386 type:complete len:123 (+) Transcript_32157:1954-2322(+)
MAFRSAETQSTVIGVFLFLSAPVPSSFLEQALMLRCFGVTCVRFFLFHFSVPSHEGYVVIALAILFDELLCRRGSVDLPTLGVYDVKSNRDRSLPQQVVGFFLSVFSLLIDTLSHGRASQPD